MANQSAKILKKILFCFFCLTMTNISNAESRYPHQIALIDTGYDLCLQTKKIKCAKNKNLLFRGELPAFSRNQTGTIKDFRKEAFNAIKHFAKIHHTKAILPKNSSELKNYRIVIINLLYGYATRSDYEYDLLKTEFLHANLKLKSTNLPKKHKMYDLQKNFDKENYAFMWWPITVSYASFVDTYIKDKRIYSSPFSFSNLPFLISGKSPFSVSKEAKSIRELLTLLPADKHPLLIYYHCLSGRDRTGAVTMAYYMTYGGYSTIDSNKKTLRSQPMNYAEAFDATSSIDPPGKATKLITLWYCQYLKNSSKECRGSWYDKLPFLWHSIGYDLNSAKF